MKISVRSDSSMQTVVCAAEDGEEAIEITDDEWTAFNDVEEHYESMLNDFAQRLAAQRQEAAGEITLLRSRLAQLESRLGATSTPEPKPATSIKPARREIDANGIVAPPPLSETDAGRGTGMREKPIDPVEFRNELADLRDRTAEKWARRGR
jgi:hypothetical protein